MNFYGGEIKNFMILTKENQNILSEMFFHASSNNLSKSRCTWGLGEEDDPSTGLVPGKLIYHTQHCDI